MVKFKCIDNYIMKDTGELAFEKGKVYEFKINGDWFETTSNIGWHKLEEEDIVEYFDNFQEDQPNALDIFFKGDNRLKYIDVALRLANIQLNQELLVKVVKIVDLVNEKGGKVSVEDIVKL